MPGGRPLTRRQGTSLEMPVAPSGLLRLERVCQGKPRGWAKLSWPFGPKTRLHLHPSFRQMSKLQTQALRAWLLSACPSETKLKGLQISRVTPPIRRIVISRPFRAKPLSRWFPGLKPWVNRIAPPSLGNKSSQMLIIFAPFTSGSNLGLYAQTLGVHAKHRSRRE
jgi:hypothetical protein